MTRSMNLSALKPVVVLTAMMFLLAGCHHFWFHPVHHGPPRHARGHYKKGYGHPGRGHGRYRLHMVRPGLEIELDD